MATDNNAIGAADSDGGKGKCDTVEAVVIAAATVAKSNDVMVTTEVTVHDDGDGDGGGGVN